MFNNLIICYLFFGGMGAGSSLVLILVDIANSFTAKRDSRASLAHVPNRVFFQGFVLACSILLFASLCLLVDLGRVDAFYFVFHDPFSSLLSFGSYALSIALICSFLLGIAAKLPAAQSHRYVVRLLELLCFVADISVMVYTGLFLYNIDFIPLWHNLFMPILFVLSSFSMGLLSIMAVSLFHDNNIQSGHTKLLIQTDLFVICLEIIAVVAYIATLVYSQEAQELLSGNNLSILFFAGFIGMGLIVPFVVELICDKIRNTPLLAFAIASALIGGFIFRYCIINLPLT